jgi:hypothetical protein
MGSPGLLVAAVVRIVASIIDVQFPAIGDVRSASLAGHGDEAITR